MATKSIYTIGGTVQAGGGVYIPRRADGELLALCRAGSFAYVLTARQMGKSSLMVRTAEALNAEGINSVIIDLSSIGVEEVSQEQWHLGLLDVFEESLDLETDVITWWQAHEHLGMSQRLILFYQEVLLAESQAPVVIFIDEIDTTLNLHFSDDFFAAIRYVYNARAGFPAFERLSFVLIGVATPSELVSDPRRTPFNIGGRIDLTDFSFEEARPFAQGLGLPTAEAERVLGWVLRWTGGHPFLTQRLCKVIADTHPKVWTEAEVEKAVSATFFGDKSEQDSNLLFIRDWLKRSGGQARHGPDPVAVLKVYRNVRLGPREVPDEEQSVIKSHLKLSGLVLRKNGALHVRNPIYERVFDRRWIRTHLPEKWYRRIPWQAYALFAALIAVVAFLALYATSQQELAVRTTQAEQRADSLDMALADAENSKSMAEREANRADDKAAEADSQREEAEYQRQFAEQEAERADSLREIAEKEKDRAEANAVEAKRQATLANISARDAQEQRDMADRLRDETTKAREVTLSLALASKAIRQQRTGDTQLAALLAREAYRFNKKSGGEYLNEVYDALRKILNKFEGKGGPRLYRTQYNDWVRSVVYRPDRSIVAAGNEPDIYLWRPGTIMPTMLKRHQSAVRSLALSSDGDWLASGSVDGSVRLWYHLDQDEPSSKVLSQNLGVVRAVAFSPKAYTLAVAGDNNISIWDLQDSESPRDRRVTQTRIHAVVFSPDGSMLAGGGSDGLLILYEVNASLSPLSNPSAHRRDVHALAFSGDGKTLASGGDDGFVLLWDVSEHSVSPRDTLREHGGPIHAVAFSPDGSMLASGSGDGTVRLWRMDNPDIPPVVLPEHTSWVHAVAFGPEGKHLISGSADKTVRRWNVDVEGLVAEVCKTVGRDLTKEEWQKYVGPDISYDEDYERCSTTMP